MKISVLIAAYHAGRYLPAALQSLSAQTYPHWELVVVEDGSRDETEALTAAFAAAHPTNRIAYENLGENRGVAAARNRLLTLAQGDSLAFLDADDLWQPTHLSDLRAALIGGAALAFSGIELWNGDRNKSLGPYVPPTEWVEEPRTWLFQRSFIQTSSCVAFPRTTFQRIGFIDETLRIGEDRDYWFRALAGGGRLVCTRHITCRYIKHEGSSMTKTLRVAADTVAFYQKHRNDSSLSSSLRRRMLAEALWVQGRLTRSTDRPSARKLFRSAVAAWPCNPRYWPYLAA